MPELPEVETIKRRLNSLLTNKAIHSIKVLRDKSFQGDLNLVEQCSIVAVKRRAKILQFDLNNDHHLIIHLKMTGQLIFVDEKQKVGGGHPTADWVTQLPGKHTRVIFTFQDDSKLFFNDMRVFGWIRLLKPLELAQEYAKYGPDIVDPAITGDYLLEQFARRSIPIKQAIMDNKILAGVGNIYASEALYLAGIHPQRPAKSLTEEEIAKLFKAMKQVINRGIELGGTTFDGKYVNVDGLAGGYQNEMKVYGMEGAKCVNCEGTVKRVKLGGRSTFFCENCQK